MKHIKESIDEIMKALRAQGHKPKVNLTEEFEVEDHSIDVTEGVSIQVPSYGDCYVNVNYFDGDTFHHYPERLGVAEICKDVNHAVMREKSDKGAKSHVRK